MAEMDGIVNCLSKWQSPDVENVIHSFASYVRCEGNMKTELFQGFDEFKQGDTRKCIVSSCGDVYQLHGYVDDTDILMKNQVPISFLKFVNVIDFTLSIDASELFLLNQGQTHITVHSVHDGSFLRRLALMTGDEDGGGNVDDGANDNDDVNPRIDMNKLGQLVFLYSDDPRNRVTTERLMYILISPDDGAIISKTLLEIDYHNLKQEHEKILISPDPTDDGLIFVGIKQYNSIHVFNAVTGKQIRKRFGDNMYINRNKYDFTRGNFDFTDEYYQHVFAKDAGVFIDRYGQVMHEVNGAHTFDLSIKPVISAIGEIIVWVWKKDSFLIYNIRGEFLRKFNWLKVVASSALDYQGRLIICERSGTTWCVK